ncbi:fibrinogen-like YCDxxxxGGGW domain-containing protein [Sorangium sp. So ce176]|uniref:fibrinogen-like YCDxxxxGGGW domain-containing protein n=1 Tax=Sorangium sp. So ce176 TaxID=3133286 RepID=UPI003F5EEBD1
MRSGSAAWVGAAACLLVCGCTTVAGLDRPYHLQPDGGAGGAGGAGGSAPADERCDVEASAGCVYDRCGAVPEGAPAGVYTLDPDGAGPSGALQVHCGEPADGGRWALVFNSVGELGGPTLAFWKILYADRLSPKGEPSLDNNHYQPGLYIPGREYRDEIEDIPGTVVEVLRANAEGIDPETMQLLTPIRLSGGEDNLFDWQFGTGWASEDFDRDTKGDGNCASAFAGVAQHYGNCFVYSLGADGDEDESVTDDDWGPHLETVVATSYGLSNDGSHYTRVKRISRWTRW